jgi:hypothetical protein
MQVFSCRSFSLPALQTHQELAWSYVKCIRKGNGVSRGFSYKILVCLGVFLMGFQGIFTHHFSDH